MPHNQCQNAQELYDHRAASYDASWHPRFAKHIVGLANLQPGETVLDLACGTGLATFQASKAVGSDGKVFGVDVSKGMLAQAREKQCDHSPANTEIWEHDITELDTLAALRNVKFDAITCCSALVLLQDPRKALRDWSRYLKSGGRMIVDVPHNQNLTVGVVMERVGLRLNTPLPWHRLSFESNHSLRKAMTNADLSDVHIRMLSQIASSGSKDNDDLQSYIKEPNHPKILKEHGVEDADAVFDAQIDGPATKAVASPPATRARAKELFREEWRKAADAGGKLREVDGVFVGIGFKP